MVFSTKKGLLKCKPEWNREAVTVFSRLPSLRRLQATPPLQTSLHEGGYFYLLIYFGSDFVRWITLGILIYISGLRSDRVIATIYNDTDEFTVQRKQAMVYNDNGNFEKFHEYWKTHEL